MSLAAASTAKRSDRRLGAIALEALKRGTGARGLRAILEEVMLEIMYELPSIQGLKECVITREVILSRERPVLVSEAKEQTAWLDTRALYDANCRKPKERVKSGEK